MIVDTGASLISLPWNTALAVGLEPKYQAPTIQCVLADGRTVEAKLVTADTVRVGKFTVEKVRCAVLSQELTKAEPLLGLSFLKNFMVKIDAANAKLMLSKLEVSETDGRSHPGAGK
jgi:aspartyl protease family protein